MENPLHYIGKPCARCKKKVRYVASRNCINCAKRAVKVNRDAKNFTVDEPARVNKIDTAPAPDYEDLL